MLNVAQYYYLAIPSPRDPILNGSLNGFINIIVCCLNIKAVLHNMQFALEKQKDDGHYKVVPANPDMVDYTIQHSYGDYIYML